MSTTPNLPPVGPKIAATYSTANAAAYAPRALVVMANYQFTPISYSITKNAHGVLDTADAVFPLSALPDLSILLQPPSLNKSTVCAIYGGFPPSISTGALAPNQLQRRFFGILDSLLPNGKEDTVKVTMRSMGALLAVWRHTNSVNQTVSAFVETAAKMVGLTPVIQYRKNQQSLTLQQVYGRSFAVGLQTKRLWDTIIDCAQAEYMDAWVEGSTLFYCAVEVVDRSRNTVTFDYGNDLKSFTGMHSPQFNKNIRVEVRTWSPRIRTAHTVRYENTGDGTTPTVTESYRKVTSQALFGENGALGQATSWDPATGTQSQSATASTISGGSFNTSATTVPHDTSVEKYIIYLPNLDGQSDTTFRNIANERAKNLYAQLSSHEYSATITIVPTPQTYNSIRIDSLIKTKNVPYQAWNSSQQYPAFYPRRIAESFHGPVKGVGDGLTMEIEMINHVLPSGSV